MADGKAKALSLDARLKEDRQKRAKKQELESLADKIFGNKRSRTPAGRTQTPTLGASLASRMGVGKRPASLPRTASASALQPRQAARLSRALAQNEPFISDKVGASVDDIDLDYGEPAPAAVNGGGGINIRGAASGPYAVIAQNFAPGTSAADIESVMQGVGGDMVECRLIASNPTVIAEMHFVDRTGAESVIKMFNNKKADGRTLHVYWKTQPVGASKANQRSRRPAINKTELAPPTAPAADLDVSMQIDENAAAREEQDRLREQRRPTGRGGASNTFQSNNQREQYGDNGDTYYNDGYVNNNGGNYRGNGNGGGQGNWRTRGGGNYARSRQEGRLYSDDQRRQQGW